MGIVGVSKAIALDMERFGVRSNCLAPFTLARPSDAVSHVTGEMFGVRNNEIYMFSLPRLIRSANPHKASNYA
jgi:hypothetical protein